MMDPHSPAWNALTREERLIHIAAKLGIPAGDVAVKHLSTVSPSWTASLSQRAAHREYGFPTAPEPCDSWTAWDGTIWTFSHLGLPWWNRACEDNA